MVKKYLPKTLRTFIITTIIFMGVLLYMVYRTFEEGSVGGIVSSVFVTSSMLFFFYHVGWRYIKFEDDYVLLVNGLRKNEWRLQKFNV